MKEFYLKRQQKHRQSMMKYLKYILNDHFLLVMLISMGGFGLYYSEFIKTIPEDFVLGKVVGILFLCPYSFCWKSGDFNKRSG